MDSETFDVSVIMATYNPVWEKCVFTLDSIIAQRNIKFELIVVDDGSYDNLFNRFETYFESNNFNDFKLIKHGKNQGTVKNYYDGVLNSKGIYIKLISPGDAFFNEYSLNKWLSFTIESGNKWSFCDAIYYTKENLTPQIIKEAAAPRIIGCYFKGQESTCRWNYVVLEDLPLGAAILCVRSLILKYLSILIDKVIYSEDLSYMIMMYDGIMPSYYSVPCMFYEFGVGVSTSNNKKWRERFRCDLRNAESIIMNCEARDQLQKQMSHSLKTINSGGNIRKKILKNVQRGGLKKSIKYRFNPRMSTVDIYGCGKWWSACDEE